MKLLIRNLSRATTEETLTNLFSEVGAVQSCSLVIDAATKKSKGFAFVEMPKVGEAKVAINKLNNSVLDGSKIRVKKAESKPADDADDTDAS
jgi:RNA recognition motif-containing protein